MDGAWAHTSSHPRFKKNRIVIRKNNKYETSKLVAQFILVGTQIIIWARWSLRIKKTSLVNIEHTFDIVCSLLVTKISLPFLTLLFSVLFTLFQILDIIDSVSPVDYCTLGL